MLAEARRQTSPDRRLWFLISVVRRRLPAYSRLTPAALSVSVSRTAVMSAGHVLDAFQ